MRPSRVIAIIDDDPVVRAAIHALLSCKGYRTEVYASAEDFLIDVDRSEAACLVVDVQLGDITGIELAHELHSRGYTFPLVFVTGSDDQRFQTQAAELGCVAYLLKPVAPNRLLDAIVQSIGGVSRQ